jgi:hypothetical protein
VPKSHILLLGGSTGDRNPWIPSLQPQKPKSVLLHGSTDIKSQGLPFTWLHRPQKSKNSLLRTLRPPKVQGLPFIRFYSYSSPRTPFMWLHRTRKMNKFHLCGYTGQTRPRTPICIALRVSKAQGLPFIQLYSHRSPRASYSKDLQPQNPKDSHLHGSTGHKNPKNSHLDTLGLPKAQGLPLIRFCSHRSPGTSFYVALQDI